MFKIMIIEDDIKLKQIIKESIERYGYSTVCVEDFKNIEQQFVTENPHLVVLDINLPYYDGFYLCRVFRRKSIIPIIIISARSGEMDQVMGIELGADDYVIKPFSIDLLLIKVKAALRRVYGEYSLSDSKVINVKGISLDESNFKIQYRGQTAELSKNEFKLVKKLLGKKDSIVSRGELLEELWDDSAFVDDNTLTVNVTRVKGKFNDLGLSDVIITKRGLGYMLDTSLIKEEHNE